MASTPWRGGSQVSAFWTTTNPMCTPSTEVPGGCRLGASAQASRSSPLTVAYRLNGPLPTQWTRVITEAGVARREYRRAPARYWQPGNLIDATRVLQLNVLVVR